MNSPLLSPENHHASVEIGPLSLIYEKREARGPIEFLAVPSSMRSRMCPKTGHRPSHPSLPATSGFCTWAHQEIDPMFQVALRGWPAHKMWQAGETMRNQSAALQLGFSDQQQSMDGDTHLLETTAATPEGVIARQSLRCHPDDHGFRVETSLTNQSGQAIEVDMLASVSLAGLTPFADDDAPHRLRIHRFRTAWSNEGRHEGLDLEDLHLERTWAGGPVFHRFGQTGSLPVRNFFPFLAIEDKQAGVFWGIQLAWHGSWQMECYRREDGLAVSAGMGDFERAHWMKRLEPGETLTTPPALVAVTCGDLDDCCHELIRLQRHLAHPEPEHEEDLPILFNEWCSSWGNPTHDYLLRTAERLRDTDTRYLVIDDGWAEKPEGADIQFNGDWNLNQKSFPQGLSTTSRAIRDHGLIPGIWFEFEPCTEGTEAYNRIDHQLHLHGKVLQVGNRHFWDFRDPWTWDYLRNKVIRLLNENDIGYLKVDYNESIGIGCDGAESLGEGLRQHLIQVAEFFRTIRREVPGIVIENCASGGHRLEPGMVGLTSMSSFSDAHETVEIPILAANLHRLIPVRKNQVWAVLRPEDSIQRLDYSLAATFLGRMCISGDVVELPEASFRHLQEAQHFYRKIVPVIRTGKSRLIRHIGKSYRYPTGWQAVVRESLDQSLCLVVLHTFENPCSKNTLQVSLPEGKAWEVATSYQTPDTRLDATKLEIPTPDPFTGMAWLLRQD